MIRNGREVEGESPMRKQRKEGENRGGREKQGKSFKEFLEREREREREF